MLLVFESMSSPKVVKHERLTWRNWAINIVPAVVGAGYLGLPHAVAELGWGPGSAMVVFSWLLSLYIQLQMMEMQVQPQKLVAQYLHHLNGSPKLKRFILVLQLTAHLGVNIVDMVIGGVSLNKFKDMVCPSCNDDIKFSYFIIIFASVVLLYVLASYHFTHFNSVMALSLAYSTVVIFFSFWGIALFSSVYTGVKPEVDYSYKGSTMLETVLSFFSGLGGVAFVFADPGVLLDIQARVPSKKMMERGGALVFADPGVVLDIQPRDNNETRDIEARDNNEARDIEARDNNEGRDNVPSEKMMRRGVVVAHVVVALCYFPIALVGYYVFGNAVDDDILITLNKPVWLITMANLLVVIQVIQTYQIYALQVLDLIKALLEKEMSSVLTMFTLTTYVLVTMVVAIAVPFLGDLLGFFGGFASAAVKYILPCAMWLKIKQPKKFSSSWIANWICIIFGVTVMILAPTGSLYKFITSTKTYKFFP